MNSIAAPPHVTRVLEKLSGVRKTKSGWSARCPDHEDEHASLSVAVGDDDQVLFHCHAGCQCESVVAALGLQMRDLWPAREEKQSRHRRTKPRRVFEKPEATERAMLEDVQRQLGGSTGVTDRWRYQGGDGREALRVVRFDNADGEKTFRPMHPVASGWCIGDPPGALPLYRICELAGAELVLVVEGEKCVEAAREIGFTATTSAHGAMSASKSDWTPLAGRKVVILPDADKAGEDYARDVAGILRKADKSSDVLVVRLPGLRGGEDIFDFVEARRRDGQSNTLIRAELLALIDASRQARDAKPEEEPEPERTQLEFVAFPLAALPRRLRKIIDVAARSIGCDPAFLAMSMLTVAASAIGNSTRIQLKEGWSEPAIIWAALVAMSGQQKSPAMDVAVAPLSKLQAKAYREYQRELREFERAEKQHQRELATWSRKNLTGEPPTPPNEPVQRRYTCDDVTIEGLLPVLQSQPRGLLMHADELASWLRSFDRYRTGQGSDVPRWLSIHGCRGITIDRKTGARFIYVPRPAVCVLGGVQPGTLRRLLTPDYFENGLAARLLVTMPPLRKRTWSDEGFPDAERDELQRIVEGLLKLELAIDEDGLPVPRMLVLAPDAKQLWIAFYNQHAEEQIQLDDSLAAAWSKLEGYAARFALVLHCLRAACDERVESAVVDAETMDAAISITRWCANESRRVYAALKESDEEGTTRNVLERVRACGGSTTVRDWQRARSLKTAAEAREQLDHLVRAGVARWVQCRPDAVGGAPKELLSLIDESETDKTPRDAALSGVLSVSEVSAASKASDAEDVDRDEGGAPDQPAGPKSNAKSAADSSPGSEAGDDADRTADSDVPPNPIGQRLNSSDSSDTDKTTKGTAYEVVLSDGKTAGAQSPPSPRPKRKSGRHAKGGPCPTCGTRSFVWLAEKHQWVCVKCLVASVAERADPEGSTEAGEWVDA